MKRAFTLVELLVVIAIIGVLIALLLPALSKARAQSNFVKCKSQLRTQLQAHSTYAVDNKDFKPPLWRRSSTGTVKYDLVSVDTLWTGTAVGQGILVQKKYLTFDSLLCPSEGMTDDVERDRTAWNAGSNAGSSYVYFWRHKDNIGTNPQTYPLGGTYRFESRQKRFALVSEINADAGHNYTGEYAGRPWTSHPRMKRFNVGFLDGSVQDYPLTAATLLYPAQQIEEMNWISALGLLREK